MNHTLILSNAYLSTKEQQEDNYTVCAQLTAYILQIQPKGITVFVDGEIGEVGRNMFQALSSELRVFYDRKF